MGLVYDINVFIVIISHIFFLGMERASLYESMIVEVHQGTFIS